LRGLIEIERTLLMTRLLTLMGAGGSGRTRLVLEMARDLVRAYSDGVWLVDKSLGTRESGAETSKDRHDVYAVR
jgi:predicted ATPase